MYLKIQKWVLYGIRVPNNLRFGLSSYKIELQNRVMQITSHFELLTRLI